MPGRRFLLATVDAGGTLPPEMGVARELVRRGHSVRVLADPTVREAAEAAGCAFTPWPTAPRLVSVEDQTAQIRSFEQGPPWRRVAAVRDRMLAPSALFASDVLNTAEADRCDAVLAEGVPGILVGALATRRPVAALVPNVYLRPSPGHPPMGTGWGPGRNALTRARNTVAGKAFTKAVDAALPAVNRAAGDHGLPPLGGVFELFDRCTRVLVMTSRSFDFVPRDLPANVRYTGPQLDDPVWAAAVEPAPWSGAGQAPLVLVAMSSVFQDQLGVLRRVAQALEDLPVQGLITTGRAVDPADVPAPPNVRVLRSAPHSQVLGQAAAVVTHAGHGTLIKALSAGVPVVCLPQGRDQKDNAARLQHLGAGLRVDKRAAPSEIAAGVRTVLVTPDYRSAARRFAARLRDEIAQTPTAADEVEAMVAGA